MLKLSIFILTIFINNFSYAAKGQANLYFAQVEKIDSHNILYIIKDGKLKLIRLAYLKTPIENEFKHEEIQTFLKERLLKKWIRVSELSGNGKAKVFRAIIRDDDQKIVNVKVAALGLGVPIAIEKPPTSIYKASEIAQKSKIGVWKNIETFAKDRAKNESKIFLSILSDMTQTIKTNKSKDPNMQIFVGNKSNKTFTPLTCAKNLLDKQTVIFATKHVGLNRKYTFIPCPEKK